MECLLRCYPAETFDGLRADGALSQRFSNMMKYVGFAPVCELVVMIIAFTPVVRNSQLCMASAKNRWLFLDDVNTWNLMFNITKAMVSPETFCVCNDHVTADQHSTAASQLLQDLIEKLSLEDTGDLLLLPLGQTSEIIDLLLETMTDSKIENGIRRSAARNVGFLLRRAAESEIVCFVATNNQSPPTPTYIPNRLFTLREKIVTFVRNRITDVIDSLLMFEETYTELVSPVKYSSYEVKRPFTVLRQLLIEVIVLTVESDESVAANIPLELWTNFIAWSLRYAHNNIYHALFYRLVFAVLRQGQETPQRILFQKAKFASFLVDNFVPYYNRGDNFICINEPLPKDTPNYDLAIRRIVARGLIMNCANAIRYQVSTEASSSFLYTFLSNHSKWSEFIAQLDTATDLQMNFGMGVQISIIESRGGGGNLMAEARPFGK